VPRRTSSRIVLVLEVTDPRDHEDLEIVLAYLRSHNLLRTARAMGKDRKTVAAAIARVEALLRFSLRGQLDRPSPAARLIALPDAVGGQNSTNRPRNAERTAEK
jgi:hypothetical protein